MDIGYSLDLFFSSAFLSLVLCDLFKKKSIYFSFLTPAQPTGCFLFPFADCTQHTGFSKQDKHLVCN